MKTYTFAHLFCLVLLTSGCAHTGTDGKTYILLPQLPGDSTGFAARSAGVTTYQGTVNGKGYTVTSFK